MASQSRSKNIPAQPAKVDCAICAESVRSRKIVACPFCAFECCDGCIDRFLMGIDDEEPRCMSPECKKIWSFEFVSKNFPPSFHNKRYRDRRAHLLLEREKALLPGSQELVRQEKKRIKREKETEKLYEEIAMYKEFIKAAHDKINELRRIGPPEEKKKERTFTRACPVEDCRGFMSTSLKCGTCSTYACKDCHLPKNGKHDDEHKCDPDLVATVKLLANDTKPCPACATPIFKISGCDQMYCTTCHTAFSWQRGTIERGIIHNPHFYEMQRKLNGGRPVRRDVGMRCGGPPTMWEICDKLGESQVQFEGATNAHRLINHINQVELPRYPRVIGEVDNSVLRVDYLMNRISEKQWSSKLKQQMKKQEKNSEFNMVLAMFTGTVADLFGNIVEGEIQDIPTHVAAMTELREYTNKALKKIGDRYGNVYPCIDAKWTFCPNAKTAGKPKKKLGRPLLL